MKTAQQYVDGWNKTRAAVEAIRVKVTQARVEAHGVKGMKSTPWRKTFMNADALCAWCERNDATVHGQRAADPK